ncbi:MAG: DUF4258 domain-containing protein [Chloroflexi bacterium]|nr:DUF4258 domain-containing protein [Chloroflexota bacterium]
MVRVDEITVAVPTIYIYIFTQHALREMRRRGIREDEVRFVLDDPDQFEQVRSGRCVYQSRLMKGAPLKTYLLRVFVDVDHDPPEVVTAHQTSKVQKYWRSE